MSEEQKPSASMEMDEALKLKQRIEAAWERRGFKRPNIRLLPQPGGRDNSGWRPRVDLRSDMINGQPQHKAEADHG